MYCRHQGYMNNMSQAAPRYAPFREASSLKACESAAQRAVCWIGRTTTTTTTTKKNNRRENMWKKRWVFFPQRTRHEAVLLCCYGNLRSPISLFHRRLCYHLWRAIRGHTTANNLHPNSYDNVTIAIRLPEKRQLFWKSKCGPKERVPVLWPGERCWDSGRDGGADVTWRLHGSLANSSLGERKQLGAGGRVKPLAIRYTSWWWVQLGNRTNG